MDIATVLQAVGLNENQVAVYITLLQMGSGEIQDIARKSGVKRTTAYSVLDVLMQEGLVSFVQKGAHREYFAEDPRKLPKLLEEEKRRLNRKQERITEALPELASLYNAHATKPKIRFYEGIDGIKQMFEETLELKSGTEMLAFSSAESIHEYLRDYVPYYLEQRVAKGIRQRAIAEDSPEAREHQKNDAKELRQTRLVDREQFPFSNEINIFGNKVMIASYKDLLGVIIESVEVARTQKAIFELAWIGAGSVAVSR